MEASIPDTARDCIWFHFITAKRLDNVTVKETRTVYFMVIVDQ